MGHQLSAEHKELYRRVDEVLHYLWDPIGVSDVPEARDEYHSYLPHVFSLLVHRASAEQITDFLVHTAAETMGLGATAQGREHARQITATLEHWREVIREQCARNA